MSTESLELPKLDFKPTCDVCDGYDERALIPNGIQWKMYGAKAKYCGYAVTVKCVDDNTWVKDIIESTIGSGKVLVIDAGKSTRCAIIGDRVAGMALENKWEGIIVYGCVRDVEALSLLDIGIHAIGNVPKKSIPNGKMVGYAGEPLTLEDITVTSGDMVYADADGVVFIKNH
jgi:regulator of ribonuclease activity A